MSLRALKSFKVKARDAIAVMAILAAAALTFSGCASTATSIAQPTTEHLPGSTTASVQAGLPFDETAIVALYENSIPAVVEITSVIETGPSISLPFGFNIPRQQGQGSGFMIDAQGHILTNNHVVDKASSVKVRFDDGTQIDAKVLGIDRSNDIALLEVDTSKVSRLAYLPLGDSDKVKPGQMAIALGSPFGLQGSITLGIVSGIGRSIPGATERQMTNIIQTDAAINPGNSGGPLLNSKGEVIGINTAIEYNANGVGFAVPINTARALMPDLLKGIEIKPAWLGIEGMAVDSEMAKKLNLAVENGVYVVSVIKDSPAQKAGLIESGRNNQNEPTTGGDVITAVDDKPVTKVEDLITYFNTRRPGDRVNLTVQRGNQKITLTAELGEWPENVSNFTLDQLPDGNQFDFGPFHFRIK